MNNKTTRNQTIAMAGALQALYLVQQIARTGQADPDDLLTCIESVLKIDAENVEDIYGDLRYLRTGYQLVPTLGGNRELARYFGIMLFHGSTLATHEERIRKIRSGVERAYRQAEQSSSLDPAVIALLAETYQDGVSPYSPQVMVEGERRYLARQDHAETIRALLLAALRSTVLWRQCGGPRFGLLLARRRLTREAQGLLDLTRD